MALRATYREAAGVTVVDIGGRITLGEGSALLRKTIRELLEDQFGPLSPRVLERLQQLPAEQLAPLGKAVLRAQSLRELGLED